MEAGIQPISAVNKKAGDVPAPFQKKSTVDEKKKIRTRTPVLSTPLRGCSDGEATRSAYP